MGVCFSAAAVEDATPETAAPLDKAQPAKGPPVTLPGKGTPDAGARLPPAGANESRSRAQLDKPTTASGSKVIDEEQHSGLSEPLSEDETRGLELEGLLAGVEKVDSIVDSVLSVGVEMTDDAAKLSGMWGDVVAQAVDSTLGILGQVHMVGVAFQLVRSVAAALKAKGATDEQMGKVLKAVTLLLPILKQIEASSEHRELVKELLWVASRTVVFIRAYLKHWRFNFPRKAIAAQAYSARLAVYEEDIDRLQNVLSLSIAVTGQAKDESRWESQQLQLEKEVTARRVQAEGNLLLDYAGAQEAIGRFHQYQRLCQDQRLPPYYVHFALGDSLEAASRMVEQNGRERALDAEISAFKAAREDRKTLLRFWQGAIRKASEGQLPQDFFSRDKEWLSRARNYRKLVEPIDLANFYRCSLDQESGPYLLPIGSRPYEPHDNRPLQYWYLEQLEAQSADDRATRVDNWHQQLHSVCDEVVSALRQRRGSEDTKQFPPSNFV